MEKTSLERSHSVKSNFKLTLICLFFTVTLNASIMLFALKDKMPKHLWGILCAVFAVLNLINLALFSVFKR